MSRVTLDGEVSSQDRISQCTVEQTLDVPVPEMVESPKIVPQDRIQQRTLEQIVDTPIRQVVAEASKVFSHDRFQQRFGGQTVEPPAISLAEKIIEMPVTRTQDKTQHVVVVNTHVQHAVNAVEAEKPIISEKINQVTKHIEIPQLQIVEKTAKNPRDPDNSGHSNL